MATAVAANDSNEYGKFNMAFHFEIYRIADNKTLVALIEALWLRMAPFVSRTRSLITSAAGQAWQVACGSHEALLNALQDVESAYTDVRAQRERSALLNLAVNSARLSSVLAQALYEAGEADFLSVLDAHTQLLDTSERYRSVLAQAGHIAPAPGVK